MIIKAGNGGSNLQSQHFGRPRQADCLSSGDQTILVNKVKPRLY